MPQEVTMMLVYKVSIPDGAEVVRDATGLVESIRLPSGRLLELFAEAQVYNEHDADPEVVGRLDLIENLGVEVERQDTWKGLDSVLEDAQSHAFE